MQVFVTGASGFITGAVASSPFTTGHNHPVTRLCGGGFGGLGGGFGGLDGALATHSQLGPPQRRREDILSDPITKEVMKSDGVDPHQLSAMLKEMGRMWVGAHARVRCACRHDQIPEGTSNNTRFRRFLP